MPVKCKLDSPTEGSVQTCRHVDSFLNTQQSSHQLSPFLDTRGKLYINTHGHSRKRPVPPKRSSTLRHGRKSGRYYFLSLPLDLTLFRSASRDPDASLEVFTHTKSAQRR
ncbi:hypothetical protein EVAR_55737_1 [Eumeta japonica]|uniref:Uncharacterized protein n=1 Tax=Eumeta variegata TaxID=151549 RepID=A0A4C1XEJ3_EUMVA|nr:hypothetical protein EVAR_55737_1 [Eumeta japonica]